MMGQADVGVRGPSDREVVAHLQRLARARAHLLHAEQAGRAAEQQRSDQVRNAEIEEAHATVLWAQAELLTASRRGRAERAVAQASESERRALRRHGFTSFRDYLAERSSTPTTDIALDLAAREFAAAQSEWDALCAGPSERDDEVAEARVVRDEASATVVIDLTGDNPRRIA